MASLSKNIEWRAILPVLLLASSVGIHSAALAEESQAKTTNADSATASEERSQKAPVSQDSVQDSTKSLKVADNDKPSDTSSGATKQEIQVKKELGATSDTATNKHGVPVKKVSKHQQKLNKETAKAVNKVPGVDIKQADLAPPADDPPIHGFHPIKKALQPVVRLEKNSVQLQQQIMKLEGPIGALQPAMNGLHTKMDGVDKRMGVMQGQLDNMNSGVGKVSTDMDGVRKDIAGMRSQISQLEIPIKQLQKPLNDLKEPLANVAGPLQEVQKELSDMRSLLTAVLGAIVLSAIAIAIGTPVAAVLMYKHRRSLFPGLRDHDIPVAKPDGKETKETARV